MKKRRFFVNIVYLTTFLAIIFSPVIKMSLTDDAIVSEVEKRSLKQMPAYQLITNNAYNYLQRMDEYFQDQYGFRESFIRLYSLFKYKIGDSITKKVVRGKDGWLFYASEKDGDPIADFRNIDVLSDARLRQRVGKSEEVKAWLEEQGISYLLVLAPNKHSIYSEYLPSYIKKVNDVSAYQKYVDYLSKYTTLEYIDPMPVLLKEKQNYRLYHKTDSHWNELGANIVQYEIAKKLDEMFLGNIAGKSNLTNKHIVRLGEGGDLARMINLSDTLKEERPELKTESNCKVLEDDRSQQTDFTTICSQAKLKALIFRDSFFSALQPLISPYFKEARYVWKRPLFEELKQYVNEQKPDIVIQQFTERHLPY